MMGSMFAGCDESPGDFEYFREGNIKYNRGMGSIAAMENGSKDRLYSRKMQRISSGRCRRTCCIQRTVEDTVFQLIGGLRSGMGYCGAKDNVGDIKANRMFLLDFSCWASLKESHPHDTIQYHKRMLLNLNIA